VTRAGYWRLAVRLPLASAAVGKRTVAALIGELARRDAPRTEAMVQADVRELLLTADLGLDEHQVVELEAQVGDRRRIDVEAGFAVIEVKKDLRKGNVRDDAVEQLAGYVRHRSEQLGQRYVGLLTDGAEWRAYQLRDGDLDQVSSTTVTARTDPDSLLIWLEGVLATRQGVPPTPTEVQRRLGATSSSFHLDQATLAALYEQHRDDPSVKLKRELWAKLLTTALGTQFEDRDELFVEHTLLVNTAEIIAHALLGFDVATVPAASLLSGQRFEQAGILGVVENHFFDWVLEIPGGEAFIRSLARRLGRFDWAAVDQDVLKVLYESVIGADTRRRMGEYYTPDWLAEHVCAAVIDDPLHQRVLDPACGSGTFAFHAVRRYLDAAESAGMPLAEALTNLSDRVIGIDLHPVAVALARVTYLLAIGRDRLTDPERGQVTVPVYLGDSLQWEQKLDLWSADHLVIPTDDGAELFASELRFPEHLLTDAARFDRLVDMLADLAAKPRDTGTVPSLNSVFRLLAIAPADQATITDTFTTMCRLHDEGRNHIWSFYVRNLARPVWLARPDNRVDVLVGNPPWLTYRSMPESMQATFRSMSESRGMWHGATVATHQDLSALFVARSTQLYLKRGGRLAFVMPNATLDRDQYVGFRAGHYPDAAEPVGVAFDQPWDLRRLRPHFFPRAAAVVHARRVAPDNAIAMPQDAEHWSGRVPAEYRSRRDLEPHIAREQGPLRLTDRASGVSSPYSDRFAQGATVVPRRLFLVEEQPSGPLGLPAGSRAVRSGSSAYEKAPWKDLDPLEGVVEEEFVRPLYLGETVLPFRLREPKQAVLPTGGDQVLGEDRITYYSGLADWWARASDLWMANRSSDRLTLMERLDFRRGLRDQLPVPPLRVLYSKAGMHLAAATVEDSLGLIDHKLYWAAVADRDEATFLCAILNSPRTTELVRPLMSYGKDERDIDKYVWQLPIPLYKPDNERHQRLVQLGNQAEAEIAELDLDDNVHFPTQRRRIREHLAASDAGIEIDDLVTELLG
jgi:SAM-dependent methyltransferase